MKNSATTKSKKITTLLALFLGGFGIHRFYLGDWKKGLLYMLFVWTYIPTIISIIDVFAFIMMNKQMFDEKYNNGETYVPVTNDKDKKLMIGITAGIITVVIFFGGIMVLVNIGESISDTSTKSSVSKPLTKQEKIESQFSLWDGSHIQLEK